MSWTRRRVSGASSCFRRRRSKRNSSDQTTDLACWVSLGLLQCWKASATPRVWKCAAWTPASWSLSLPTPGACASVHILPSTAPPLGVRLRPSCGLSNDCEMRDCTQRGSHRVGRSEDAGFLTSPVCSLSGCCLSPAPLLTPLQRERQYMCEEIACCTPVFFSNLQETVFLFPPCPSLPPRLLAPLSLPPLPFTTQRPSWSFHSQGSQGCCRGTGCPGRLHPGCSC